MSRHLRQLCPSLSYRSYSLLKWRPGQKINIAFLSSYLSKNHSVCKDRAGIIHYFVNHPDYNTYILTTKKPINTNKVSISSLLYNQCHRHYRYLSYPNLHQCIKVIESLRLHVLVYCEIGMCPISYLLAHMRLAPIQLNTWGHSQTSGVSTIDYYVSSKHYEVSQKRANEFYSEQCILHNSLTTYYYPPDESTGFIKGVYNRSLLGLPHDKTIYSCFQALFKLLPEFDHLLGSILKQDPNAIILLINSNQSSILQSKIQSRLLTLLGPELMKRIILLPRQSIFTFLGYIEHSDVILDSYPFGGCNSSLECFYLDKPIITLPSDQINGRFTYGFYQIMNIQDCIATSCEHYVELAIRYGTNKELRNELCQQINKQKHLLFKDTHSQIEWEQMIKQLLLRQK